MSVFQTSLENFIKVANDLQIVGLFNKDANSKYFDSNFSSSNQQKDSANCKETVSDSENDSLLPNQESKYENSSSDCNNSQIDKLVAEVTEKNNENHLVKNNQGTLLRNHGNEANEDNEDPVYDIISLETGSHYSVHPENIGKIFCNLCEKPFKKKSSSGYTITNSIPMTNCCKSLPLLLLT